MTLHPNSLALNSYDAIKCSHSLGTKLWTLHMNGHTVSVQAFDGSEELKNKKRQGVHCQSGLAFLI